MKLNENMVCDPNSLQLTSGGIILYYIILYYIILYYITLYCMILYYIMLC